MLGSTRRGCTLALALIALALGCSGLPREGAPPEAAEPAADRIFLGDVVTIDAEGTVARAVAVKGGRVLLVGDEQEVLQHRGRQTEVVDLAGGALLPGFIDPHSHLMAHAVPITGWVNVARPPVGEVENIPDLLAALDARARKIAAKSGEWIVAWGYEKEGLAEGRELTRDDLDARFPHNPVAVIHVSSHGAVLNSAALRAVGIGAGTPTPPGGQIVRKPGSQEPAGLIMETAFFAAAAVFPQPSADQVLEGMRAAQLQYAANGYTTIQDGLTSAANLALLRRAAAEKRLFLDVVALPDARTFASIVGQPGITFGGAYQGHLKLGGVKSVVDGSAQARTAYFGESMLVPGPAGQRPWRGEPIESQSELDATFRLAYQNNVQTYTHANGDAAIDMVLAAHEAAGAPTGRRPVIIHSQFVRPEQLNSYARIGAVPSFFTNHAFFWGDVHVKNLGQQRAFFLSPLRSAIARGLHFTNHSDYAVTPLDPMFILWTATERTSRSGAIIGPDERISVAEALRAITIDAAYQYFEEDTKGSIEPGKLADFAILDRNPLDATGQALRSIRVRETIKEGETVYKLAEPEEPEAAEPDTAE
ncbi:MAG: amidohydrolase [Deltaproteobacteria bacterium]|nr:MAG: amidohydrolase [Deltaproteobacteria bacterium]